MHRSFDEIATRKSGSVSSTKRSSSLPKWVKTFLAFGRKDDVAPEAEGVGLPVSVPSAASRAADAFIASDVHTQTWENSLEVAVQAQVSETVKLEKVALLMQNPDMVSTFATFDAARKGTVANADMEKLL